MHTADGTTDVHVRGNGQAKVLTCCFYISTARAGEIVHVIWNTSVVEFFDDNGEHLVTYPRPKESGWYYGPRTPTGTKLRQSATTPAVAATGTTRWTVSRGGYVGALANKFYAGYHRQGQDIDITWTDTTVTLTAIDGTTIATYNKPTQRHGWHGPGWSPSTKS